MRSQLFTALATGLALTLCAPVSANLITNGGFEGGTHSGGFTTHSTGSTAIAGWTVTSGSVDWIHNTFWEASEGTYSIDLSGDGAGSLQASTSFATTIGQAYRLSFDMAGNSDGGDAVKDMRVSVNGGTADYLFDTTGQSRSNMGWATMTLDFIATASTTSLGFASLEANVFGPALDNVSVVAVTASEPAALALVLGGMVMTLRLRRRG